MTLPELVEKNCPQCGTLLIAEEKVMCTRCANEE